MNIKDVKIRISRENCFYGADPDLIMRIDYTVLENNGIWTLSTKTDKFSEKPEIHKLVIDTSVVNPNAFLKEITEQKISIFPEYVCGLDGGFTELEICYGYSELKLKWWSCPPKEWIAIDEITDEFIKKLQLIK